MRARRRRRCYPGATSDSAIDALIRDWRPAFPNEGPQDLDDAASAAAEWERKYGDIPRRLNDSRDLLIYLADCLVTLGLEPDIREGMKSSRISGSGPPRLTRGPRRRTPGCSADERRCSLPASLSAEGRPSSHMARPMSRRLDRARRPIAKSLRDRTTTSLTGEHPMQSHVRPARTRRTRSSRLAPTTATRGTAVPKGKGKLHAVAMLAAIASMPDAGRVGLDIAPALEATRRPAKTPTKSTRYSHREEAHPDGPSEIERGNITLVDDRAAVALRAAIDDAIHGVAVRFSLSYSVEARRRRRRRLRLSDSPDREGRPTGHGHGPLIRIVRAGRASSPGPHPTLPAHTP